MKSFFLGKQSLKTLTFLDILVLSIILFGQAIYHSSLHFFTLSDASMAGEVVFTAYDNYAAILSQAFLLALGLLYLRLRNFDFSQWKCKINLKSIAAGIALFVVAALFMDIYSIAAYNISYTQEAQAVVEQGAAVEQAFENPMLSQIHWSTVAYALLNGLYEELFFLGMCLFVAPKKIPWVLAYSILVRFSFHTYQGLIPAIGIGLLGFVFYFWFQKWGKKNLFPAFFAHAIADVIGLGIIFYIWH